MFGFLKRLFGKGNRDPEILALVMLTEGPSFVEHDEDITMLLKAADPDIERLPAPPELAGPTPGVSSHIFVHPGVGMFLLNVSQNTYVEDVETACKTIAMPDHAERFRAHKGWVSVDLFNLFGGTREDALAIIGKVAAEAMPDDTVLLYRTDTETGSIPTPALLEALAAGDWLDVFEAVGTDPVGYASHDDPELNAARAEAVSRLPEFINAFESGDGEQFMVKAAFTEDQAGGPVTEYMWVLVESVTDTGFTGILNNEPNNLASVRHGQQVAVGLDEIHDWMYGKNFEPVGGFQNDVLIARMNGQ